MVDIANIKRVHCIGIGGIGLSALAEILLNRGYEVSGSDMKESETTDHLMKLGASIHLNHRKNNIGDAELVIFSSAVGSENPEIVEARKRGIPIVSRAEALGALMQDYRYSVAVAGAHGKTTTTSMISIILQNAGKDPTILVGGRLAEINGNVKIGKSDYFVTEACEYMNSFLELSPKYAIILNIDSDHLDYFKDIDHIVKSFEEFAELVPNDGAVVAYDANPFVTSIITNLDKRVITFGFHEHCDYYAADISFNASGMPSFSIYHEKKELCSVQLLVPGEHNIANALAAFATCHDMGVDGDEICKTLSEFKGTQRRFDLLGMTQNGVRIIDDYAHHPTEILATLSAAVKIPHKKLWCLFQPHTYTRTLALHNEFAASFETADKVVLAEIYPAREKNIHKISSKTIVNEIKELFPDKDAYYFKDFDDIVSFVINNAEPDDLVITMGAGDIYKVGEKILDADVALMLGEKVKKPIGGAGII